MFFYRSFFNYVCIEGAKFGLLSVARPITIFRNEETGVGCNNCNNSSYDSIDCNLCIKKDILW